MGILVFVLLLAAWGLVLAPALLRQAAGPPDRTEQMFRRALGALGGPKQPRTVLGGRWVVAPAARNEDTRSARARAADRRRRAITGLSAFIVVTFLLGLTRAMRPLLYVNLVADIALCAYLLAVLYVVSRPAAGPRPAVTATSSGESIREKAVGT